MAKNDGNLPGPAITGEGKRPTELDEDEKHELGAEIEKERLREEEPDPNQHGPAVGDPAQEEEEPDISPADTWEEQYSMSPGEYLSRYGEDATGSELAQMALEAQNEE